MNHQIEDNAVVSGARNERPKPPALDQHRFPDNLAKFLNRSVETLYVTDMKNTLFFEGDFEQLAGFLDTVANGLFDENVNPVFKEHSGDIVMVCGGNGDDDRIDFADKLLGAGIGFSAELIGQLANAGLIEIRQGGEVGIHQLSQRGDVVTPHVADSGHSYTQHTHQESLFFGRLSADTIPRPGKHLFLKP